MGLLWYWSTGHVCFFFCFSYFLFFFLLLLLLLLFHHISGLCPPSGWLQTHTGNGVPMWVQQKAAPQLIGKPLETHSPYKEIPGLNIQDLSGYAEAETIISHLSILCAPTFLFFFVSCFAFLSSLFCSFLFLFLFIILFLDLFCYVVMKFVEMMRASGPSMRVIQTII